MRAFSLRVWDFLGILASALCIVHCLSLPLLLMIAPALAWRLWLSGIFVSSHIYLFAFVASFFLLAFVPGYLRHRSLRFAPWAAAGLLFVALGSFVAINWGHQAVIALNVCGGLSLIRAHWLNYRAGRACAHAH